jgi:signal peptidase I
MVVGVRWILAMTFGLGVALFECGCGTASVDVAGKDSRPSTAGAPARRLGTSVYRVPTLAMEPTLRIGTLVVVGAGRPTVGAIVVYHPPEHALERKCGGEPHTVRPGGAACDTPMSEESKVKDIMRIVAGPRNEIYIREGVVYRRTSSSRAFGRESSPYVRACVNAECNFPEPIVIPAGYWFLMGDNRGASNDSRFWGPVPTAWIVGIATGYTRPRH